MKIALIGYGKMGKTIGEIAEERGHQLVSIIDEGEDYKFSSPEFMSADVAIEFTTPGSAMNNYRKAFDANVPVVSGTTGWTEHLPEVKQICEEEGKTFFYASNFSLGVNIFFAVNKYLAKIMNHFPDYDVRSDETHHIHKLDAPSGTALTIAEGVLDNISRKKGWTIESVDDKEKLFIDCKREGEVPGYHAVQYDSPIDTIRIEHNAKSRKGFALGAVLAAEFSYDKKGFLGMSDLLNF